MALRSSPQELFAAVMGGSMQAAKLAEAVSSLSHSDLMNRDDVREHFVGLVAHPDPEVRSEAMRALAFHGIAFDWGREPGKSLISRLMMAVRADGDADVRRTAAAALGSLFRATREHSVERKLAEVVQIPRKTTMYARSHIRVCLTSAVSLSSSNQARSG